jgi:hypothetical protein
MTDPFDRAVMRDELERHAGSLGGHRIGFWVHATVYAAVNLMLFAIWALTGAGYPWFVFPLLGWGVALAVHGVVYRAKLTEYWEGMARRSAGWPG